MKIIPGAEIPYLGEYTWANRPSATDHAKKTFLCSDVGNGILLYSDGLVWRDLAGGWITLFQGGVPVGIPSSGSIGNNGALSGLTAFVTQFPAIYLYFPANAIYAGSAAGLYYCVMSSTTAGTIYNNTYSGGKPSIPASPTPFSTTGPGAYTQSTSEITLLSPGNLPGGMMGINGFLLCDARYSAVSGSGIKTVRLRAGGVELGVIGALAANYRQISLRRTLCNIGVENNQSSLNGSGWASDVSVSQNLTQYYTVNTSLNQALALTGAIGNASDWLLLDSYQFAISPRG